MTFSLCAIGSQLSTADTPKAKISYTQRIRIETADNATHLSPDSLAGSSYMRQRTSLMAQLFPDSRVELAAKITNEMRYYFVPESKAFTIDEVIVDLLYARCDSLGGRPVSVIVGRQNITLGEGFVIMDGGPLDGSRSAYFNALRTDWMPSTGHVLTGVYARQTEQDWLLPIVHNQRKKMVEGREEALFIYYAGSIGKVGLQAYAIRKNVRGTSTSTKAEISCIGGRFAIPVGKRLDLVSEVASQFGDWASENQTGLGGYSYLDVRTGWPMHFPKSVQVGVLYLSGDDPATPDYEGWEPMFGRYPKWSDSYIYTLVRERGVAYWTNLMSVFAKSSLDVAKDVTLSLDYHHLMAPQRPDDRPFPGGDGTTRGNLVIAKLAYTMSPRVSGHVLWESFTPGSYYFDGADSFGWMRMELFLKF